MGKCRHFLYLVIAVLLVLTLTLTTCAPGPTPTPEKTPTPALTPMPTATPAPAPETTTYTAEWAQNQVSAYLYSLAGGPDAIRYLAELYSQGYFQSRFYQSEVDQDVGEHKFSGWSVYYKPTNHPSRNYWHNLNWAVCKDGYVVEGSNDALLVKADLIELSQPEPPSPPSYHELSFELSLPEGAEYDAYCVPIYLKTNQTLHFSMEVKYGEPICLGFYTPSGGYIGLEHDGDLSPGYHHNIDKGIIVFSPSQYSHLGWGEGYYKVEVLLRIVGKARVHIEYWIED